MRLAFLGTLLFPIAVQAQDATARRPANPCFVAYDSSRCRTYTIMEVGVGYPMLSTRTFNDRDLDTKATFAFGAARNRPGRKSIGGALLWDFGDSGDFGGMELRVRDWIDTSNVAVEWSVGYARPELRVARGAGFTTGRLHGVRGGAAVTICPYVTTFVRGELARANGKNRGALFGGAGFTSHASYISVLSAALGVGVLLLVAPPVS